MELAKSNSGISGTNMSTTMLLLKARTFIALIVLVAVFSFLAPNFLAVQSIMLIAKHVALYAILGIGMTFVVVSGGIDLSVGSIVGLAGMIAGGLIYEGLVLPMFGVTVYFSVPMVILITLITGTLMGSVNGLLVTKFNVAPFIATLGMLYVARGIAMLRSDGKTFPNLVGKPELGNTGFPLLGAGTFLGIPYAIWIMIVLGFIAAYLFKKTPFGWHIFAVGGNERAAELSGVRVKRVKILVYMFSGFCAAIVGLIVSSQLVASHPATGETWELNAIAAAVLGGTSLAGGRGTIGGTVLGAFVIGVLSDGMVMMGVSEFWQMVIKGLVIVLAVIVDQFQRNLQNKLALESRNK
ncbi:MAG TPA: ABC transporter permease [Paenibacillus sp.]|uniref:ABC transporter permease n=1 Tax=Paenibacillus sp. TaxID=58172 RepID=UPI002BC60B22|nr:ABC transporter permease [Paenibacillus sp.]HUC92859.1 ABC transporter permease [Paenibacillus sp.]